MYRCAKKRWPDWLLQQEQVLPGVLTWHPIPVGNLIEMVVLDGQGEGGAWKVPTRMICHGSLGPAFLQVMTTSTMKVAKPTVTKEVSGYRC